MAADVAMEGTKSCPYCAEAIKAAAIKCRFCGSDLISTEQRLPSTQHNIVNGKCVKCGCSEAYIKKFSPACETVGLAKVQGAASKARAKDTVKCPKCMSENISANKRGFGLGNAVVGGVLVGGVGLLGGFIGSRKLYLTCLKCGHQWKLKWKPTV